MSTLTIAEKGVESAGIESSSLNWREGFGTAATHSSGGAMGSFDSLVEAARVSTELGDAVLVVAKDGRLIWSNTVHDRVFGPYDETERIGDWSARHQFSERIEVHAMQGGGFTIGVCLETGETQTRDLTCRSWRTHDLRWFRAVCTPFASTDHGPMVSIVFRDLSEHRNLKSLVERLQMVEAASPHPTFQMTADGSIRLPNSAAQLLLNAIPNSNSILSLLPDLRLDEIADCIERGGTLVQEFEWNERCFTFSIVGMPHLQWAHVYGFETTAFRVSERQLRAEKQKAEIATRVKSEFLANMSHEIRTPMNGILGMASFLMDSEMSEQQRDFAETIHSSGESLLAIINDILDFSKLEAQRLQLENVDFELNRVVADTMDLLARQGQKKGLEILVDVANDVPDQLVGDPVRLRQILNNFIGNAIKFTESGQVKLTIRYLGMSGSGIELEFVVSDSGIGIPEDKVKRLFRPFTQAESSTTRKYGGTGLGLVISKTLVELMHGTVHVNSAVGRGSSFAFSAKFGCRPGAGKLGASAHFADNTKVLVVDDHPECGAILARQLERWNIDVERATHLDEMLSLFPRMQTGELSPDLVLVNVSLGQQGASQIFSSIREAFASRIPAIVGIGTVDEASASLRFSEVGFQDVLAKPIKPIKLYECLKKNLIQNASVQSALADDSKTIKSSEVSRDAEAELLGQMRVLLVEDNEVNVKVALEQLNRIGIFADRAANGAEALKRWDGGDYDVVLMDCQMPVLDGFQATLEIRSREREQGCETEDGIPIIAMTANAMDGDRERCLASGMSDYLSKPVRADQLRKILVKFAPQKREPIQGQSPEHRNGKNESPVPGFEQLVEEVGAELALEILKAFIEDSRTAVVDLKQAIECHDTKSVLRLAHTLKGASATCGRRAMVYTCLQMEALAKEGEFRELADLLDELSDEIERTLCQIEEFRPQLEEK